MLEFEHIVQVNDPSNAAIIVLTRNQLWQGLVLRARNPEKFNNALQCESGQLENGEFVRNINTGSARFRERVLLYPKQKISTKTIGEFDQINAQSTTSIEEPEKSALFVRFYYKRDLDAIDKRMDVGEHLKAAYIQVDKDAIELIRLLAESSLLDQTID